MLAHGRATYTTKWRPLSGSGKSGFLTPSSPQGGTLLMFGQLPWSFSPWRRSERLVEMLTMWNLSWSLYQRTIESFLMYTMVCTNASTSNFAKFPYPCSLHYTWLWPSCINTALPVYTYINCLPLHRWDVRSWLLPQTWRTLNHKKCIQTCR